MKFFIVLLVAAIITSCQSTSDSTTTNMRAPQPPSIGTIVRLDPALDDIISPDAKFEIIADSLTWSEGPLWVEAHAMLLFSDVPANKMYKWTEAKGKEIYLNPSGFTGEDITLFREPGSNGIVLDATGNLILCQHGDRRIARMNAPLDNPTANYISLAEKYKGQKFSSPNDVCMNTEGEFFFTDPPYGLHKMDDDPLKEIAWNGVYKLKKDGTVMLLTDSLTKPNGIALFPDEKKLLVANSDPEKPNWYVWDIEGDNLTNGKIFYTALPIDDSQKGLPDGLKITKKGHVIASGPGGIYFFDETGKKLGMVKLSSSASNCALSMDEKTLFITNHKTVLKVNMKP